MCNGSLRVICGCSSRPLVVYQGKQCTSVHFRRKTVAVTERGVILL